MNAIVSNKNEGLLSSLDIEVIKSINGEFSAEEIIQTFSNFFFNKLFLDITAVKDYKNIENIQKLSMGLDMTKVILLLDNSLMTNNSFLSKLISMGIYNFASTRESLMYLYNHPNTYKDVASIHQLDNNSSSESLEKKKGIFFKDNNQDDNPIVPRNGKIIGFKNATQGAGATTLVYLLKKALSTKDYAVAIEVNKNDFGFFNEKDMYSVSESNLQSAINKFASAKVILVDLNNASGDLCDDVVYLMEPSIIKLNKMVLVNKDIFEKLSEKRIILNKSLLSQNDISDFEFESHLKITYNMPPINDRADNQKVLEELINILEI